MLNRVWRSKLENQPVRICSTRRSTAFLELMWPPKLGNVEFATNTMIQSFAARWKEIDSNIIVFLLKSICPCFLMLMEAIVERIMVV